MPDITKGYTFTDSKADWASEKDTAIRLNKMVDDAKVNIVAGTGVTVARTNGNIVVSATSGSGTVTNVSVVTANGFSGAVANSTTTPAITLSLADGAISYAKIQNVSDTNKILGRSSAGAGPIQEITCTAAGRAIIDDADAAAQRNTIGLGNVENTALSTWPGSTNITTLGTIASGTWNGSAIPIANGGTGQTTKTDAFDALSPLTTLGDVIYHNGTDNVRLAGSTANGRRFLRQTGNGTISAAPAWDSVTNSDVGLGNVTNDAQTRAAIVPNDAPASGQILIGNAGGTAYAKQSVSGDITLSDTGAAAIANNAVTNTKLADMAASTIKGRQAGSTGDPQDLTGTQATALLDTFTSSLKGLAPSSGGGTSNYLRADGTWAVPAGTAIGVPTTGQQYSRLVNNSTPVTAGSFVNGITYVITSVGSTNFTLVGAANNLVGTVFTATGAGSGTGTATPSITSSSNMKWVGPDIYNVKDYGATGNGSTNDASAINSAIADINTAGFGCLYFPQGVYVVSSALTTITASCSVMGTGVSSTEIQFTVSGFKFDFSGTANSKTARVSDMKLTRTSGSSLVGIEYVPTTDTNARHRFDFSHLNLFDWGTAIYINGGGQNQIQSGFISYCHINGSGTRANSPYAIRIKNATGVKISGCWFISVEKCVSVESHAESIGVQDCNAAAVDYFFYAVQDNVAGVPVLRADHRIINCYMAVDIRGVTIGNLDNINYCVIANNVIATQINTAEAIKIRGDYSSVVGNTIWPDKTSSPAVTIKVVSGNNNIISSNIIQDKAVVLESGTTSCRVVANTFKNVTGAFVSDSGTTNRCDEPTGKQVDKTLTGGAATENVDFDISAFGLSKKPQYFNAVISGTHGASKIMCCYDYGSASTTATNARCVAWMTDGTNLPSGSRTFNTAIVP